MFGRGYVIDHCVSTHNSFMREKIYRAYVTDVLKAIAKVNGITSDKRYVDLAYRQIVEETRTPEEIIDTISTKLKKLGEGET